MPRQPLARPNFRLRWVDGKRGGAWYIDWTERKRPKSLSTRTADEDAARAQLQQLEAGYDKPAPPREPTISEILMAYISDRRGHIEDISRIELAAKHIGRHVGSLQPALLARRTYWERRRRETVSAGTILREGICLRAALKWAWREGWIKAEPYIALPPKGPPRERWLSRDEAARLMAAATAPHLRLFIMLALNTAARRGAILDLTWERVDLDKRLIHFHRPGRAQSKKRRITVPINDALVGALQEAREAAVTDWVIEYRGRQAGNIRHAFERTVARAGIAYCHRHDLRRTAATWMVMGGVRLEEVAAMLGDTKEMVERHYGKWSPDYLSGAARALAGDTRPKIVDSETAKESRGGAGKIAVPRRKSR